MRGLKRGARVEATNEGVGVGMGVGVGGGRRGRHAELQGRWDVGDGDGKDASL